MKGCPDSSLCDLRGFRARVASQVARFSILVPVQLQRACRTNESESHLSSFWPPFAIQGGEGLAAASPGCLHVGTGSQEATSLKTAGRLNARRALSARAAICCVAIWSGRRDRLTCGVFGSAKGGSGHLRFARGPLRSEPALLGNGPNPNSSWTRGTCDSCGMGEVFLKTPCEFGGSKNRNSKMGCPGKWEPGPRPAVCPWSILSHTHGSLVAACLLGIQLASGGRTLRASSGIPWEPLRDGGGASKARF